VQILKGLPFEKCGEPARVFWQARFYDFNVYSQKKKIEKFKYTHANPLKRGLVRHAKDWPWSSWAFYPWNGGIGPNRLGGRAET
jgi:REP element-mobilizing transposase RayT